MEVLEIGYYKPSFGHFSAFVFLCKCGLSKRMIFILIIRLLINFTKSHYETVEFFAFQAELMGGEESTSMKEIASSSLTKDQQEAQEKLAQRQEEEQVKMDTEHAKKVNEMKQELDEDAEIAKQSIDTQMDEQKKKVV